MLFLCWGVTKTIDSSKLQSVPIEIDENEPYPSTTWEMHRAAGCFLLNSESSFCNTCAKMSKDHSLKLKMTENDLNVAATSKAPLAFTHPNKVALALNEKRAECKDMKTMIERLKKEIEKMAWKLNMNLENRLVKRWKQMKMV